jgi:hypothetical protein
MMDVRDAQIFWNHDDGEGGDHRVTELIVAEINEGNKDTDWFTLCRQYDCNDGNCWINWATAEGHGPEVVFRALLIDGFKSPQHLIGAIREFAKIRQCQWAQDMLKPHVADRLRLA